MGRFATVFVLAGAIVAGTYAFTAANTMPATSHAGDGATVISGYAISGVDYGLDALNPAEIDTVTFTAAPAVTAGSDIEIQVVNGGTWYNCPVADPVVCTLPAGVTVLSADNLRIIIAD